MKDETRTTAPTESLWPGRARTDLGLHRVGGLEVAFEMLAELLGLPPEHRVIGVDKSSPWNQTVTLAVAGPDMPPVEYGGGTLPPVQLNFRRLEGPASGPHRETQSRWGHAPSDAPWHPMRNR